MTDTTTVTADAITGAATSAAPYFYGYDYYDSGYGSGCGWLYQRAVETGSPYWWRRCEDCID